jgi:3-hydroxymyristoyl/3-hydroxydecanoyl-(acyl carrier protein) dehydratase
MRPAGQFSIAMEHPCLPGHFPGRPVVPGVVLLEEVFGLIVAAHPGRMVIGLPQVRFLAPVLPGQVVEVAAGPTAGDIGFTGAVAGREVLRGRLELGSPP